MRLASMLRGASEREEPPEAPAPATSPRHKQRWRSALAFAKTQTRDESGPAVFSHQGPDGAWEPYDAARCLEISAAMEAQGPDGAIQLDGIPFEVRWGSRATSSRVATCVEINQCVGCTRQFFIKSFLGDDAAVPAPLSGDEAAPPRHRAGVASMAWRTTRRSARTRRKILISTQTITIGPPLLYSRRLKRGNR